MKSASEYWRRVEDLYHRAVECNGRERQTLLDQECGSDNELRREVEALLAGHKRAPGFLEEPDVGRLTAGTRLSNYEIIEHIGSGGMGDVYRARDTKLNRSVAIKFLSANLADASARRRFQREAQMVSSLNHPHILTVHDTGEFEGQQYLVTEFVDGGTLREWARREKPSVRRIVDLAIGIADALACAQQAGILHRDIKPENILVSKDNHAKLVDFGLAKLIDRNDAGGCFSSRQGGHSRRSAFPFTESSGACLGRALSRFAQWQGHPFTPGTVPRTGLLALRSHYRDASAAHQTPARRFNPQLRYFS